MNEPPSIQSEQEQAAEAARRQFLQNQALMLMNNVRGLKAQLLLSTEASELPPQLRQFLYNELIQCAGIVEVRDELPRR